MVKIIRMADGSHVNQITGLSNVTMLGNGRIVVDGMFLEEYQERAKSIIHVHVHIDGNCESVENCESVNVFGTAGMISTMSGDVRCGDVRGNVKTMSGDVTCKSVAGNISTLSGDVDKSLEY